MTTEIMAQQNGVQPYQEPAEEFDDGLAPGEAKPARLSWNGRDGVFVDSLTGEVLDSLTVVYLKKLPDSRIMFNPNSKAPREERVLCRSSDTITPDDLEQARFVGAGPTCAECPFHDFGKDKYNNVVKPPCSPLTNLAIATDDEEPVAMLFSTKSLSGKAMRQVIASIANLRAAKRMPPFYYKIELARGEKVMRDNEAYYPLVAKVATERVSREQLPDYANLWRMVSAYDPAAYTVEAEDVAPEESAPAPSEGFMTPDELLAKLDSGELAPPAFDEQGNELQPAQPAMDLGAETKRTDPADVRRGRK